MGITAINPRYVFVQATEPSDKTNGKLWYNTTLDKLYASDGANYNAIEVNVDDITLEVNESGEMQIIGKGNWLAPIGAIFAWLKSYTNTPNLPTGWVECNGQTLSDAESVFNGQTIPDLNGSVGNGNKGQFLRGHSLSGVVESSQNLSHSHQNYGWSSSGGNGANGLQYSSVHTTTLSGAILNDGGTEARPYNYSVVWVMRVK